MSLLPRLVWLGFAFLLAPFLKAEGSVPSIDATVENRYQPRTAAEIERLVGRIALHPDVLIALMLPASRDPVDIVLASRAVSQDPNRTDFSDEPWSDSVQRLARYPDALALLDEDLEWTTELGEVFSRQPADVMDAIQTVRERARKYGYLGSTKHQVVVVEEHVIRIHPYSWDYVYVPYYNWRRLYYGDYCGPNEVFISFGSRGYAAGYWRGYDCDWRQRRVWISPSVRVVKHPRPSHSYRVTHDSRATYRVDDGHRNHEYQRHGARSEERRVRQIDSSDWRKQRELRQTHTPHAQRPAQERRPTTEERRVEGPRPRVRSQPEAPASERKEYRASTVRSMAQEDREKVTRSESFRSAPEVRRNHERTSAPARDKGSSPHAAGGRNRP